MSFLSLYLFIFLSEQGTLNVLSDRGAFKCINVIYVGWGELKVGGIHSSRYRLLKDPMFYPMFCLILEKI